MGDSEKAKKPHRPKKRNAYNSRAKSATSKAVSAASAAQDMSEAFRQLRASSMPAHALLNLMKNLDPFYGMRDLTKAKSIRLPHVQKRRDAPYGLPLRSGEDTAGMAGQGHEEVVYPHD